MITLFPVINEISEAFSTHYRYIRISEITGRTVRVRIERGRYLDDSVAVIEAGTTEPGSVTLSWTTVTAEDTRNWFHSSPAPHPALEPSYIFGPLADQLLGRAAAILDAQPMARIVSPHLYDAISALLTAGYGYDGERRTDPNDIAWARSHGGTLRIVEHPDGAVTFTKAHREDCPFITSTGKKDCDGNCVFPSPADSKQRLGR
jgi:hypothetical protein